MHGILMGIVEQQFNQLKQAHKKSCNIQIENQKPNKTRHKNSNQNKNSAATTTAAAKDQHFHLFLFSFSHRELVYQCFIEHFRVCCRVEWKRWKPHHWNQHITLSPPFIELIFIEKKKVLLLSYRCHGPLPQIFKIKRTLKSSHTVEPGYDCFGFCSCYSCCSCCIASGKKREKIMLRIHMLTLDLNV